jgi:hypothetical protein
VANWIRFPGLILACLAIGVPALEGAVLEQKPILDVTPSLTELGPGWTTNVVAYLLDPRSQPSEIDYQRDPKTSLLLAYERDLMRTNNRTGCAMVLYGYGNMVMNSGLFRVHIQRWDNRRSLHNAWVGWKMDTARVVRNLPPVGEDCFWTNDWWRQTAVRQNLIFRRGLFHVVVEAGAESESGHLLRLAEVIDAKLRGRPIPKEHASEGAATE